MSVSVSEVDKIVGDDLEIYLRIANASELNDVEWKCIVLRVDSVNYLLLHGFPGDNPIGFVFYTNIHIAELGEHTCIYNTQWRTDAEKIRIWYEEITEDACNYEDEMWN